MDNAKLLYLKTRISKYWWWCHW